MIDGKYFFNKSVKIFLTIQTFERLLLVKEMITQLIIC